MLDPTLDQCRALAVELAPELRRGPLYVMWAPAGYPPMNCRAFHTSRPDPALRAALIDAGEWHGNGNAVVFAHPVLFNEPEDLFGTLIHEIGHALPFSPSPPDVELSPEDTARTMEVVARWAIAEPPANQVPWHKHGAEFTRVVLHLAHRATCRGISVPLPCLGAAGMQYGLSGLWAYARALADEPARLAGEDFTTILTTAPPAAFADLFSRDVAHYWRHHATA